MAHYCGEMDCLINHIIRHICRLADQIEVVFFEQIPFVKFVSAHAAVLGLGHRETEAGSLVYPLKVLTNLDCFWRWDHFSTRFISSEENKFGCNVVYCLTYRYTICPVYWVPTKSVLFFSLSACYSQCYYITVEWCFLWVYHSSVNSLNSPTVRL